MIHYNYLRTRDDGVDLVRTTSDKGLYLMQLETNLLFPDPIDVAEKYFDEKTFEVKYRPKFYHYIESNIRIEETATGSET